MGRREEIYTFQPDYAIPPGYTLSETIDTLGITQFDLAIRTGLNKKTINQIIRGKAPLTTETAVLLERVTGVPARMWNNLESNYREQLAKLADRKRLESDLDWLKTIPVQELIKRGVIPKGKKGTDLINSVLSFFGVSSSAAWKKIWLKPAGAFRKSQCFIQKPEVTATWLRLGELEAQKKDISEYKKDKFMDALKMIRQMAAQDPDKFWPKMIKICAEVGVALICVPEIKGCRASGVARWLPTGKALIQLSLRHKTNDHFWFTFYHEAGHILNGLKKEIFIEDGERQSLDEIKADQFAADSLIPRNKQAQLKQLNLEVRIKQFAKENNLAPGIVVGRLQREKFIGYNQMNKLKRTYDFCQFSN